MNIAFKVFFVLIAITGLGFLLNTSFIPVPNKKTTSYEPVKDFSFLKRFYCISDLFSKEQWQNNKGRSFDEGGIHLTNLKKHPVNACHYALFCFDEFKTSGDSIYYNAFVDQVNYLLDSTSYHIMDSNKIAYPYFITFHDLRPPWYSALAQSEAISVLIRYYSLTNNADVLPVLRKIMNFMISSQEFNCGTMSITPEGNKWYEEYPNSKQERQVLNGFFLSIVALYEYTQLFPGDNEVRMHYESAIKTVKESFRFYDTGSWLKYNRGDGRQVSNGYMKWQVLELKLLYELTNDIFFKHTMMLTASYCYNKPYETAGSKLQDYDFSIPLSVMKNDMLEFEGKSKPVFVSTATANVTTSFKLKTNNLLNLWDGNMNTFTNFKHIDSLHSGTHNITIEFKKMVTLGSCQLIYSGLDSLVKPLVTLYYKNSLNQKNWTQLTVNSKFPDTKSIKYKIHATEIKVLGIFFPDAEKFMDIKIANLSLYYPSENAASDFRHYITPVYKSGENSISLDFDYKDMRSLAVFHKSAIDEKALNLEK